MTGRFETRSGQTKKTSRVYYGPDVTLSMGHGSGRSSSRRYTTTTASTTTTTTTMATTTTMVATTAGLATRAVTRHSSAVVRRTTKGSMPMTTMTSTTARGVSTIVARAADADADATDASDGDAAFEAKLGALRGKRSKRAVKEASESAGDAAGTSNMRRAAAAQSRAKGVRDFTVTENIEEPAIDWGTETIVYEGPPARGEVVANVAMSWTLVWLPLAIQAIGRALWLNYKITDKRVSVVSVSPLRKERTDIPMDQIQDVVSIGRGIGAWGDMVVTLRNGEKVELRSLPEYKKCEEVIREKMYKEKIIDF